MSRTVEVNGARQYDLNLGRRGFYEVSFEADGDLYLDNIHVYNFVQDGQLRDIDGRTQLHECYALFKREYGLRRCFGRNSVFSA